MATGDVTWFRQALHGIGSKLHNLETDDLRLGIITSVVTPTATTADPHWGGTGTTDFATNQVATGGTSYTAPQILQISSGGAGSQTWTVVSNEPLLRADVITLNQDGSGFTNGRWGIIYNNTDTNKRALAFVDFGADKSLVTGQLIIDWNSATNDVLKITS